MKRWVGILLLASARVGAAQANPEDVVRAFFKAEEEERWQDAAALLDQSYVVGMQRNIVHGFRNRSSIHKLTVEELMRADSTMPRAVAEYQLKRMNDVTRDSDFLENDFARITTVDSLALLTPSEAAARYRLALGEDPSNTAALFSLGRLLVAEGHPEGVEALRQVPSGAPEYSRARAWLTLADFFEQAGEAPGWLNQLGSDTQDDSESRYRMAAHMAREGRYADAISQLLAIVERDRAFRDDGARKTLLALFEALGDDPLVTSGRRRLASALF